MQNTEEKIKNDKKTKKRASNILKAVGVSALAVVSLLVTFGGSLGVPSWNEIFAYCGIYADLGGELTLSFIDVGSADACYIKCGDSHILVDAGTGLSYENIYYHLKRSGCTHFDAIVLSHPDNDHIGSAVDILKDFGTDVVYMSKMPENVRVSSEDYKRFVDYAEENGVPIVYPEIKSSVKIGEAELEFISPLKEYSNTNNNSLVVRLKYKDISALFTGDISKIVENDLIEAKIDLKADILKVAHHGSKTASSEEFLKKVNPKISVISVNTSDSFLPDYETVAYIDNYSEQLYRTDKDGTVVVTCRGDDFKVHVNS